MSGIPDDIKQRVFAIFRRFRQEKYLPLLAPNGVTPSEANAIIAISMSEKAGFSPVQPHIVAKGLHQTPSAVSQTLKALEEKGYLRRERLSADSRAVSLMLTESGKAVAQATNRLYEEYIGELYAYIGEEDAEHLLHTLERIVDFLATQAQAGRMERIEMFDEGHAPPGCGIGNGLGGEGACASTGQAPAAGQG
ncbi:MAG: MarR family winged helix-turn-helix transcriptional regulator [Eggerthellaceae bacterium]|nr:MarR family winged helix-turn-helix transcriptional regulator [Eggerthellaceae bacterium]